MPPVPNEIPLTLLPGVPLVAAPLGVGPAGLAVPEGWSAAELHMHTSHSDGTLSLEGNLELASGRGLAAMAVTDHDKVGEGLRARELANRFGLAGIAGTEVTTRSQHHVVGLFIKRPIRLYRSVPDTVAEIRDQGGLAIVAHPFMNVPNATTAKRILSWLEKTDFDGIELESQYLSESSRRRLADFYRTHHRMLGAAIGGTDAHFGDVGRFVTLYPGSGAKDLADAIRNRQTIAARTKVEFRRPTPVDYLTKNYRSLLALSGYRVAAFLTGRYQ